MILFDAARLAVLHRLCHQHALYWERDTMGRARMRERALLVAYTTAKTNTLTAAKNLTRGFLMSQMRESIRRRAPLPPQAWDRGRWEKYSAKARFAKALSGFSLGADAVCLDVWMLRLPVSERPACALSQWALWLRLFTTREKGGKSLWALHWHMDLLRWVAGEGELTGAPERKVEILLDTWKNRVYSYASSKREGSCQR